MKDNPTIALLVAAGFSERMNAGIPKPYLPIGDETVMKRAVKVFLNHPDIDGVRVVIRREHHPMYRKAIEGLTLFPCVIGGKTRQESVRLGLESLIYHKPARILIHDVARPLVNKALISRVIEKIALGTAVITALSINDTVKRITKDASAETVNREHLYAVQTPQGFMFDELLTLHREYASESLTDDAGLYEKASRNLTLVEGNANNIKITTEKDLERMHGSLGLLFETRTGMGYDVHPLRPHDPDTHIQQQNIKLCGVKIPHTHYLRGFSDADVGLHAIVDAILGSISAGDIGQHFPPDDLKWQGADSSRFLMHAYEMLRGRGGELVNIDVTLICERPKIAPYRNQMIHHIAQLLKVPEERISIKATTTEKLGFEGRSEGIAAQAIVSVRMPIKEAA
ncbi:MAG: bifunctional 2-C-methyl-D-erythritol 4-phosphate cytidylyltransferase/2-C-methyl-D-erythritol 2,4-cyclodiphosphate synthase [Alphaproteobacteria bacterium]